jgi:hypothetical protein
MALNDTSEPNAFIIAGATIREAAVALRIDSGGSSGGSGSSGGGTSGGGSGSAGRGSSGGGSDGGEQVTLINLLKQARLSQYAEPLIEQGWDDLDFLRTTASAAQIDDLAASVGMKAGHLMRFKSVLRPEWLQ